MGIEVAGMTDGLIAQDTDYIPASRAGAPVRLSALQLLARNQPHPRYYTHLFASNQALGDGKAYDMSGAGNHAVRGANLTDAQLFANAGFFTTIDPATGVTDSVLHLPSLNFDYNGGEKILLYWLGQATAEGSNADLLGDGTTATYHGFKVRINSTGKIQVGMYDTTNGSGIFGSPTTATVGDGVTRSFGLLLDGTNKKYGMWVDEVYDSGMSGAYQTFSSGTACDTRTAQTFQIGAAAPAVAASTVGIASKTRAFVALRLAAADAVPSVATVTAVLQQLRANPGRPVLGSAF